MIHELSAKLCYLVFQFFEENLFKMKNNIKKIENFKIKKKNYYLNIEFNLIYYTNMVRKKIINFTL